MFEGEHRELARRLFTIASLRLERLAEAAGAGQANGLTGEHAVSLANDLVTGAQELVTLSETIALLAELS